MYVCVRARARVSVGGGQLVVITWKRMETGR